MTKAWEFIFGVVTFALMGILALVLVLASQRINGPGAVRLIATSDATGWPYPPLVETFAPQGYPPPVETPAVKPTLAQEVPVSTAPGAPVSIPTPKPFYLPPNGERIVYFASSLETLSSDMPVTGEELQTKGVTVVDSFDSLLSIFVSLETAPEAVILHRSRSEEVDGAWLREIYLQGVVLAGVDLTIYDLADLVGETHEFFQRPHWIQGGEVSFRGYAVIAIDSPTGLLCGSPEMEERAQAGETISCGYMSSSNSFRQASDVDTFLSLIRRDIAALKQP